MSANVDIRVIRVRRQETVVDPRIAALIGRAIIAVDYPGTTPQELYAEWAGQVALDTFGLFVGFEGGDPAALAILTLPTSHAMIAPQCLLAYSEGRPDLARRIALRLKGWLMENGFGTLICMNRGRDDDVFIRGFRHLGRGRRLGSILEFSL